MIKLKFLSFVLCLCMILSVCSVSAWAEPTLSLGDFDYNNIKITVSADTFDLSVADAMVYIYKSDGTHLDDDNPPVYMDFEILENGVFKDKEILLPETLDYGSYKVAVFYNGEGSPLTGGFTYYSPSELLQVRKDDILLEAKSASDAASLKAVFFNADSAGGLKLPANDEIIASSADFTDYDQVQDVLEVFNRMIVKEYKNLTSFEALIALFEECATRQKNAENRETPTEPSTPGNDNTTTGGNKGSVSISGSSGGSGGFGGSSLVGGGTTGSTGGVTPNVTPVFNDIKGHWAESYVKSLYEKNIINGYDDGSFRAGNNITRAELTKMLVTAFNIDGNDNSYSFTDVSDGSWYFDYVKKASSVGIITGYLGLFNPDGNITRQDAALMVYRSLEKNGKQLSGTSQFNDDTAIAAYASDAVKALGGAGILTGDTNGNFNPTAPITRAEIAAVVCRALEWAQSN